MTSTLKEHVFVALRKLLTPIVKMLLRNGVTYKEFCVLSKDLYVEVASADFGLRGRPTNVSRSPCSQGSTAKKSNASKTCWKTCNTAPMLKSTKTALPVC